MTYRRLTANDIELVLAMNMSFREGLVSREAALAFLCDVRNWLYAAVDGNIAVGFAYGYALPRLDGRGDMLYIHEVGVAEARQSRGIGTAMLSALLDECRGAGMSKAFLITQSGNAAANALYRKLGGVISEDIEYGTNDMSYYFPLA